MAKYIDADRLKAELDEHYRNYQSKYMETRTPYTQGLIDALDLAEQVIDSFLQEQPEKPVQNDLEKAAKEYAKTTFKKPYSDNPDEEVTIVEPDKYAGFIAGARHEDEQLSEKIAAAYQLGLADKEKQMMKEAVEGEIVSKNDGWNSIELPSTFFGDLSRNYNHGDKVRIIIVKE